MSRDARVVSLCLFGLLLLASGCTAVGDFCYKYSDCPRGLRCTSMGGKRGVCTYPGGMPDVRVLEAGTVDQIPARDVDDAWGSDLRPKHDQEVQPGDGERAEGSPDG